MISNFKCFKCYCRQYLNPNERFYVTVRNDTLEYLHSTLFYTFHGKEISKPAPTFGPGKTQQITFPDGAIGVFIQIFRSEFRPPASICTKFIDRNRITHLRVREVESGIFTCSEIPNIMCQI